MSEVKSDTNQVEESKDMESDSKVLIDYIEGDKVDPPQALNKALTNLYQKLQMSAAYSIIESVRRQQKLLGFINRAEEKIYDIPDEAMNQMDPEVLKDYYESAQKTLDTINEFERRFLAQNKDTFMGQKTEQEKLAEQLLSLPPSKLEAIMNIIRVSASDEPIDNEE